MKRLLILLSLGLAAYTSSAQDFSNKGKDFWVGYGLHCRMFSGSAGGTQDMVLYFATDAATNVKVEVPSVGYSVNYSIPANTIFTTAALPKTGAQDIRLTTEGISSKAIHVTADKPIVAYAHIYNGNVSGATLLFPTNTLGKEYYSINFSQYSNEGNSNCFFYAIATDTGTTTIEVVPTATTQTMTAGQTYTFNLQQGQVFNALGTITGNNGVDLTGSKIRSISTGATSCKPIAVFSGSGKININCPVAAGGGSADNYMVQSFPKTAWGKRFLTVPTSFMPFNYFRICVTDPTTVVKVNGTTLTGLIGNFYYQLNQNNTPNYITADKPITVAQYITTAGACGNSSGSTGTGDPEVIYLSPIEQNIAKVILNSTQNSAIDASRHYINVIIPTAGAASFKLDGVLKTSSFVAHPQLAGYSYAQLGFAQGVTAGQHTIQSDSGFNAIAYGYGNAESYGYNAGTNIKDLFQFLTIQNQYATVDYPATCVNTPFYFSITLPYQATSLKWDFKGMFPTVTNTNPTPDSTFVRDGRTLYVYKLPSAYNYAAVGTFPVTVTATNPTPEGCSGENQIDYDVQVFDKPRADWKSIHSGCMSDTVRFLDSSITGGRSVIKWKWDFGDMTTDTVKNPKKLYTAGGTFNVKLNIITDVGCIADTTKPITISTAPSAKFGVTYPNCPGVPVTFSDSSSVVTGTLVKWYWDYGNGKKDTLTTNASRTVTYATPGTYVVKLVVETSTGCKSTAFTYNLKINAGPIANFSFGNVCLPDGNAQFTDLSTISDGTQAFFKYNWDFGDGGTDTLKNPIHQYTAVGPFNVKLIVTSRDGCVDDTIRSIATIYAQPKALFTAPAEVCLGDTAQFTDNSSAAASTITRWRWDFGNGVTDTTQNPRYVYPAAGTYTVRLVTFSAIGCISDTATKDITVNKLPTAGFTTSSPVCETRAITFTDTSKANSGVLTVWQWDMGDGTLFTKNDNTPFTYTYATNGTYTVKLALTTDKGCKNAVFSKTITVNALPFVDFKTPRICLPAGTGQFTDLSTISDGTAGQFTYAWDFGDGGTSTQKNPIYKYNAVGPYTVKLTVTSNNGCVKDTSKVFNDVFARPKADFTVPAEVCLRDSTKFTDASTAAVQSVTRWRWDFGNGKTDTTQNPTILYTAANTYTIKLFVYSNEGCISDTAVKTHVVNPLPTPAFINSTPVCETKQITFTNQSVANAGNITRWYWSFGDGNINDATNGNPVQNTYAAWGNYDVKLFVSTDKGCKGDTLTKPISIKPQPVPAFILPEVCLSDAFAQFTDSSYIADNSAAGFTYLWNFGDPLATPGNPNTSTLKDPKHKYLATGNYVVTLTVTSANNCVATLQKTLVVNGDIPVAKFNVLNSTGLCSNVKVEIQNKSTVNFGNLTKAEIFWDWANNPGLKDVDDVPAPDKIYSHLYPNFQTPLTKTYQVRFVAYSGGICVDDTIRTITVNASPKTAFAAMRGICLDASPQLIAQAREVGGVPGTFTFSGPGVNAAGLFDPATAGVGTHTIQYLYVSNAGCRDSITQTKTVWPRPDANFGFSSPRCETKNVTFSDSSRANFGQLTQWKWKFGDATTQNNASGAAFNHIYTNAGSYTAELQVVTDSGCTSIPVQKTIQVNPQPKPDFTLPTVCMPAGLANFTNTSTIADGSEAQFTYAWDFGEPSSGAGNTANTKDGIHNYGSLGPFNVSLTVTSKDGCVESKVKQLTDVNPQPRTDFTAVPPFVCIGDAITFNDQTDPRNQTLTNWNWDFGDGTTGSLKNMMHLYTAPGTYDVSLYSKSNKGCFSDTITKPVTVFPYPVVNAGPDLVVLEGGQIKINATVSNATGYRYRWTPPTWLDSDTVLTPIARPTDDVTYRITVTADGGCSRFDDVFIKLLRFPIIPNAFSPNKDGINDTWVIKYLESYPGATVQIFDRYGRQVFYSVGYDTPWDGKLNGTDLPVGVYYYIVDPKNGRKQMNGSVTILR